MKKDSFLLYTEQIEVFNSLTDEQAGQLIKAIYQYNKTGELPELNDILKIAIIPIKQQLDRNALKYEETREKRKLAGAKGGKQKGCNYSYWTKNFKEMAFKTLLRQLISKWGIMSIELQQAYINDTAIIEENKEPVYIDTIEAEPIQETEKVEKVESQETKENDPFDVE